MIIDRQLLHDFLASRAEDAASAATTLVGWTSNPNTRGTASILYSCFSVLLLCSYKCHHPPVPPSRFLYTHAKRLWNCIPIWFDPLTVEATIADLRDMLSLMVLPEVGVATALNEYSMARQNLRSVRSVVQDDPSTSSQTTSSSKWPRWLSFEYAPLCDSAPAWRLDEPNLNVRKELTIAHAFYAQMGGIVRIQAIDNESDFSSEDGKPINLHDYVMFLRLSDPEICKRYLLRQGDIDALAKADVLSKLLALLQSAWLVLSTITRHAQHLPITPLELSSCAYVLCAAVMYTLWWHKPYGALQRLVVYEYDKEMHSKIKAETQRAKSSIEETEKTEVSDVVTESALLTGQRPVGAGKPPAEGALIVAPSGPRAYTASLNDDDLHADGVQRFTNLLTWGVASSQSLRLQTGLFYLVTLSFGAVHLVAWNWTFPSATALEMWRVLAVICTAAPVIVMVLPLLFLVSSPLQRFCSVLATTGVLLLSFVYLAARTMTLILACYCLKATPVGTYTEVSWTKYLPAIS